MNKSRRKWIADTIEKLEELKSDVESIRDEEEEYKDNMPENLSLSEKYEKAEEAVSDLEYAIEALADAIDYLNSIE